MTQVRHRGTYLTSPRVGGSRTHRAILHSQEVATRAGVGLTLERAKGDFFEVKRNVAFLECGIATRGKGNS